MTDPLNLRRSSAAAQRNRDPILEVLRAHLPPSGLVLEIASGTGEHITHFARHLPKLTWQPSDPAPEALASMARFMPGDLPNLRSPIALDTRQAPWPVAEAAAIVCINMVHISPWSATEALMRGAKRVLRPGGVVYLYGPYRQAGLPLQPGNAAFDSDLRSRHPEWGLREVADVVACAQSHGFYHHDTVHMPADNLSLVLIRGE
ncbi:DUF938 domain-containing protein [Novosphingobium sp. FSY-8]|uniref:DUF938 domain-containing protein n=1 Tax=Novosphingobium ovatum TaxID=1908523 RepID=A0ABW9XI47_9SPHN|nr:DUF938 domain-containing protein [Novosphingobium ovatum]NBC38119.1 DUF938 domain-containing protein [Novosphingobium ovatum]